MAKIYITSSAFKTFTAYRKTLGYEKTTVPDLEQHLNNYLENLSTLNR